MIQGLGFLNQKGFLLCNTTHTPFHVQASPGHPGVTLKDAGLRARTKAEPLVSAIAVRGKPSFASNPGVSCLQQHLYNCGKWGNISAPSQDLTAAIALMLLPRLKVDLQGLLNRPLEASPNL